MGTPKATAAAQLVGRKAPGTPVFALPCKVTDPLAVEHLKGCHVVFGCGDNDGVRQVLNDLAVRCLVPLIDLGCDVQVDEDGFQAGGQARVVIAGDMSCLVCGRGFDPAQAALDLMSDEERAVRANHGYFIGADAEAAPSIGNLNAVTAQLGVSALLSLALGSTYGDWSYVHFDQLTAQTVAAGSRPGPGCPVCGPSALLSEGGLEDSNPECEASEASEEVGDQFDEPEVVP